MYFKRADRKIREACYHLNSLTKSENVDEFETIFASFLSSSRSVTLALTSEAGVKFDKNGNVKEKGGLEGFAYWYVTKQDEMRKDELCKFFKNIRDEDIHTAKSTIQSRYTLKAGVILAAPKNGILKITDRGTYDVYENGTPKERSVRRVMEENEEFRVAFAKVPIRHLGKDITHCNPIVLCNLYKNYLENLVLEAKEKFWNL